MSDMALQDADQNMWKAYGVKLYNTFMQGQQLGQDQRFYLAPLSQAGIAASATGTVPTAITNQGVYNVSNTLLSLDSPCYMPTASSYFDRCQLQLGSVFLDCQGNMMLQTTLDVARAKAAAAQSQFTTIKAAALTRWLFETKHGLTTLGFVPYVIRNYPQFSAAQTQADAAAAAEAQAVCQINSPAATLVSKYIGALANVNNGQSGYTMPCSTAPANWIASVAHGAPLPPPPTNSLAAYDIPTQYAQDVDTWTKTYPQNVKSPQKIELTMSDFASSAWSQLGFSDSNTTVNGSAFCFFTATYTEHMQTVSKQMSLSEAGADCKITLTYTSAASYNVNPSTNWNPSDVLKLPVVSNAPAAVFEPAAMVSTVIMAYGCGISIDMSSACSSQIQSYLKQVQKSDGSASLFGFNIGLGDHGTSSNTSTATPGQVLANSSATNITIPPDDNGYPTLLAAIGTSLPVPQRST